MRTTDGPAFAATSMTAEFSSTVIGWRTGVEFGFWPAGVIGDDRSNAPLAGSATTVPPEAMEAAARAAASTVPTPTPRRAGVVTGWAGTGDPVSNQRSGVGAGWPPVVRAPSARGSGAGENEAPPAAWSGAAAGRVHGSAGAAGSDDA